MEIGTRHDDVAAYVLGVLGREDAEGFEQHLARCGQCQLELDEFRSFTPLLRDPSARAALSMSARQPVCKVTRSILYVAAGFVVAIAAVLSVVQSLAGGPGEPVEVSSVDQAGGIGYQQASLFEHV
ncbi:zf-HC2 domain-containing protein [Lentzea tibetensis]|uniref:Zf-HC2 domain-containing protein n=1 Tax=Lentzea tibetensis TaxID=2591470 RepID=A0A563EPK2_9PSEU|nr:zf-HC2 domain-containing protein [Lentzea tibetensis]TWP49145.1 zf-HC2 domain-containing protein [Lentzea tibetensis]